VAGAAPADPGVVGDRPSTAVRRWAGERRDDLLALAIYATARAWFLGVAGARMDLQFLGLAPQLPDVDVLQDRLVETVWFTHTQPPLYTAFVGLVLKASPFPDGATFLVVHLAMGAALILVLRRLFGLLGLGRAATFVALALVAANPSLVAIELVVSYDLPTTLLLALLALKTARYVASASGRDLAWVAGLSCAIVLTRTVFHPVWLLLVLVGVIAMRAPTMERRRAAAVVGAPLALVALLVMKNLVLFDVAGLTSFAGPSTSKLAGAVATDDEIRELQADGTVSAIFGRPVFFGYEAYADALDPCVRKRPDIPVLAQPTRPSGYPNMNDECMLEVYELQGADGAAFARARPSRFVAAQAAGAQMFFEPALPIIFTSNADELGPAQSLFRATLFAQIQLDPVARTEFGDLRILDHGGVELVPIVLLADLAAIALGLDRAWRLVRRRTRPGGGRRRAGYGAWAAVGLTCGWVTTIGSLLEINENARYRMLIEPFLIATIVFAGQAAVRWAAGRARTGAVAGTAADAGDRPVPAGA
jgi:hypothetical protein